MIDPCIEKFLDKKISDIYISAIGNSELSLLKEFVMLGGKRLRPIALLETYKSITGDLPTEIINASLCVELFHNGTLVHDDVIDEDLTRRNVKNILGHLYDQFDLKYDNSSRESPLFHDERSKYVVSKAVLYGNMLELLGNIALQESKLDDARISKASRVLENAKLIINAGQIFDINLERAVEFNEKTYINMIYGKTAYLYQSSCEIGAILAGASEDVVDLFGEYGIKAGLAFQIQDDMLELLNPEGKGHEYGADIKEGKRTLITIKSLSLLEETDKSTFLKVFKNKNATNSDIDNVVKLIESYGIFEKCKNIAANYVNESKSILHTSKISEYSTAFHSGFADFMLSRNK